MKSKILFSLLLILVVSMSASAQRWEKLGERTVNFRTDRDEINCTHKGRFDALKIKVEKAPVEFEHISLEFLNGSKQKINVRQVIRAGGESRVIHLRGNNRVIKKITFTYRTDKRWKKARVSVLGRH